MDRKSTKEPSHRRAPVRITDAISKMRLILGLDRSEQRSKDSYRIQ